MKTGKIFGIAAICAAVLISASCGAETKGKSAGKTEKNATLMDGAEAGANAGDRGSDAGDSGSDEKSVSPTCIDGEKDLREDAEEVDETAATEKPLRVRSTERNESAWPSITLSGDPEDVFTVEEHCFYEGDRYILYFQEGVKVRGDSAIRIEKVMQDLEDTFGMSYDYLENVSDSNWRYRYFDSAFEDVNENEDKVNILVTSYKNDGVIEWAGDNTAAFFEEDVLDPANVGTLYHELAHVLQIRNSHELGQVFEEGFATYCEYYFTKKAGIPDWSIEVFARDPKCNMNYDESAILQDAEEAFIYETENESGVAQTQYQYGIRFVYFLVDTYGRDAIKKICDDSLTLEYGNDRTDMFVRIIKDGTSKDVFKEFGAWLPEGWAKFSKECDDFFAQF